MKIVDRIKNREALTPTENEIASFIRDNPDSMINMSLEEFSAKIYVSKSTIIRFCKKFGFHGHKELCVELAKELNTFVSDDPNVNLDTPYAKTDTAADSARKMSALSYKAISDTYSSLSLDSLQEMARIIHSAMAVTVYAVEENQLAAMDIAFRLQAIGYQAQVSALNANPVRTALGQNENSPALFITYTAREPHLIQSARVLNRRKIPVCLISGSYSGTLRKLSDVFAEVGIYESQPRACQTGPRTGIFLALDILYAILFNMDYDRCQAAVNASAEGRASGENGEPLQ